MRRVLREDPDIVLIGEMRDLDTIRAALTIAETGHLTFGTLHTSTAVHTITRIISSFPANEQEQVRMQLSGSLKHVICQQLLPTADGDGRCLAAEVMVATSAVQIPLSAKAAFIRFQSAMQTGINMGMLTLNQSLDDLVASGKVTAETADEYRMDSF